MLHNILNKIEASIKTKDWMKKSEQICNNRSCRIRKLHIIILIDNTINQSNQIKF